MFFKAFPESSLYLEFRVAIKIKTKLAGLIYRSIILLFFSCVLKILWSSEYVGCRTLISVLDYCKSLLTGFLLLLSCALSFLGLPKHSSQRNPGNLIQTRSFFSQNFLITFPSQSESQSPSKALQDPLFYLSVSSVSLKFFKHGRHPPASGPLHLCSSHPIPGCFPRHPSGLLLFSFRSVRPSHLKWSLHYFFLCHHHLPMYYIFYILILFIVSFPAKI